MNNLKIKEAMVNENMRYGIDPSVPPENAEGWRVTSCLNFEKEIEKDVTKYSTNLSKMKKKLKKLRIASSVLTGGSTILAIGGTAISSTVVGVIVGGPIVGFGTIVGAFSLLTLKMEKNIFKEIVKNEKLLTIIYSKLSLMREKINNAWKDNKIEEKEYKYIEYEFNQYKLMEEKTLTSSKKESQQQNMSTKEIIEKLAELLKK